MTDYGPKPVKNGEKRRPVLAVSGRISAAL
jgi:hypothetical protein